MTCRVNEALLNQCRTHAGQGRVVVFDTETTGISKWDEIVQIAAAEYVKGCLTRQFNVYLVPTCAIHPEAEAIHHLSREFLECNGIPPVAALAQFYEFLGNDVLLVAHNIRFDLRMLQTECRKFKFAAPADGVSYCDTLALARRLVPGLPSYRLGRLIACLGLEGDNSHNALDDSLACAALFFDLVRRIPVPGEYTYEPLPFADGDASWEN